MILGNLKVMGDYIKRYPKDFHPQPLFTDIARDHNLRGLYYMDLYPFNASFVFLLDPEAAIQVQSNVTQFPRHSWALKFLGGIPGSKSLFSTFGLEWQHQRSWFAPAFSMQNLLAMVPGMVEETLVFKEKLTQCAVSGEVFNMNDLAMRLAIDFIARTMGDIRLKSQTEDNAIYDAFQHAIGWTAGHTDPWWKHLLSPFMMWWHVGTLNRILSKVIRDKMRDRKPDGVDKSILDRAWRGYLKETGKLAEGKNLRPDLDAEFMQIALDK